MLWDRITVHIDETIYFKTKLILLCIPMNFQESCQLDTHAFSVLPRFVYFFIESLLKQIQTNDGDGTECGEQS